MKPALRVVLFLALLSTSESISAADTFTVKKIEVERLPDLNIPRAGHQVFYAGGELTVAGGHTNGFVPTPTAEYYADGKWHQMPMTYNHDFGLSVVLKSGKVFLAGGCEQPTGIGQTYTAELYDPQTHTFRGFGNMSLKRAWVSALELDSGQVIIAGNWYAQDGIELFHEQKSEKGDNNLKRSFIYIKDVSAQRSSPYIFRMADGDALIFGSNDNRGDTLRNAFVDHLKGDTLHIPLFERWSPLHIGPHNDAMSNIGDESQNDYTYLLAVQDSTGQVAIARVCGTEITLLPTACPVPMVCQGDSIEYGTNVIVDRQAQRAYLLGISTKVHTSADENQLYVLCIDYAQASEGSGAPLTLYYTKPLQTVPDCMPLLTPEGNLLIAGGLMGCSNYTPSSAVWLLRVGGEPEKAASSCAWWIWIVLGILILVLAIVTLFIYRHRKHREQSLDIDSEPIQEPVPTTPDSDLMNRISSLMEERKPYLDSELKLGDVAIALGTNRNAISSSINVCAGCSFTQFVNTYRINHAKRLMRSQPNIKMLEIWTASGFATESYFFRTFKAMTGMTPSDWKQNSD